MGGWSIPEALTPLNQRSSQTSQEFLADLLQRFNCFTSVSNFIKATRIQKYQKGPKVKEQIFSLAIFQTFHLIFYFLRKWLELTKIYRNFQVLFRVKLKKGKCWLLQGYIYKTAKLKKKLYITEKINLFNNEIFLEMVYCQKQDPDPHHWYRY